MLGHRAMKVEDYLTILKRRWWIIAIPVVIFPIIAAGLTYAIPAEYISQTTVLIDQQKVPTDVVKSVVTESIDTRLAFMEAQILSRSSIQPIVEKYNLYGNQHLSMDGRIDLVRKDIHVVPVESAIAGANGSPGFKIIFSASDPHTAQQVCSEVTSLFTRNNLQAREAAAEGTTDFLKEQLAGAKRNLDDQDAKLAAFQRLHIGMLPEDAGSNMNVLATLNSRLDASTQQINNLQQNQSVAESLLASQQQSAPVVGSAPAVSQAFQLRQLDDLQAKLADLQTRYTDDYPEVKSVRRQISDLQREMAKAASAPAPASSGAQRVETAGTQQLRAQLHAIQLAIQSKRKEQDQLEQQIRNYQGRVQSSPEVEAEFKGLTRDYQTAEAFYNTLLSKMNQAQMATALEHRQEGETFTLLDPPNFPIEPFYPKMSVFAMGGVGAGLALGVLIVAFLEYRDTALRTERDVWEFTHLPTLAVIAWSGETAEDGDEKLSFFKRLFSRKNSKKLLADAAG